MTCPSCSQENPAGARFCGGCGTRLEAACPACQAANPPGNRFCHQCGGPLQTDAAEQFASPRAYTPKHLAEKILRSARDRKSTRLNSSHGYISYAVFCLKKKKQENSNAK